MTSTKTTSEFKFELHALQFAEALSDSAYATLGAEDPSEKVYKFEK